MDEEARLAIFHAQTENVRALDRAWKHINRQINESLRTSDQVSLEVNTKILTILYCALAEAAFSKLLHTPHGLTLDEIKQVKTASIADGVKSGWIKCAELAVRRVEGAKHNHQPNVTQTLGELIKTFIYDPSLLTVSSR